MNYPSAPGAGGFSSINSRTQRWDEGIQWLEVPPNQWLQLRFAGPIYTVAHSWFESKGGKRFGLLNEAFDPSTGQFSRKAGHPVFELFGDLKNHSVKKVKDLEPRKQIFIHAFVRDLQKRGNVNADPQFKAWRPAKLPISAAISLAALKGLNKYTAQDMQAMFGQIPEWFKGDFEADVNDTYWGTDVMMFYNPQAQPQNKYTFQMGQKSPLTAEEQHAVTQFYDWNSVIKYPSRDEIMRALEMNGYMEYAVNLPPGYQPQQRGGIPAASNVTEMTLPSVPQPPQQAYQAPMPPPPAAAAPMMAPPPPPAQMAPPPMQMAPPPAAVQYVAPAPVAAPPPMQMHHHRSPHLRHLRWELRARSKQRSTRHRRLLRESSHHNRQRQQWLLLLHKLECRFLRRPLEVAVRETPSRPRLNKRSAWPEKQ